MANIWPIYDSLRGPFCGPRGATRGSVAFALDKKHRVLKVRVSATQLSELVAGAARSNPSDPPALSAWMRDVALREASRLRDKAALTRAKRLPRKDYP